MQEISNGSATNGSATNSQLANRLNRKLILWYVATLRDPNEPGGALMYRLGPFSTESEARKAGDRWQLEMGGAHKTPYWWVTYKVDDVSISTKEG